MEAIVNTLISTLSPSALPLVVVVVAALYFYYKLRELEKDRSNTKQQRDDDRGREAYKETPQDPYSAS